MWKYAAGLALVLGASLSAASPASAADPVRIGVTLSETGPGASLGIPEGKSVRLLPKEFGGQPVEWIILDDGSDTTRAVANMRKLIAEVPDGPPHRFRWRRAFHAVRRYEGPERIAAEWWRRRDNGGLTRDYYRVEDVQGRRYWLFRHGLYDEKPDPRWYIHGVFA